VGRQQGLVGRHHVLALADGLEDEALCRLVPPDELDDDRDLRVVQDGPGVPGQDLTVHRHRAGRLQIEVGDLPDDDPGPETLLDQTAVFHEQLHGSRADVAEADQAGLDGLHGAGSLFARHGARAAVPDIRRFRL